MIDKKAFRGMRKEMELFDTYREQLIKNSRDVLKLSKAGIYSMHRNDFRKAYSQLKKARGIIKKLDSLIKKERNLVTVGAYAEGLEEYVEAACYYAFIKNKKLPTRKQLGVTVEIYLSGIGDLVGELVRRAINSSIKGEYRLAVQIKNFVATIYAEMMMFDFRNTPTRRKFDGIKYGLERLENLILDLKLKDKI